MTSITVSHDITPNVVVENNHPNLVSDGALVDAGQWDGRGHVSVSASDDSTVSTVVDDITAVEVEIRGQSMGSESFPDSNELFVEHDFTGTTPFTQPTDDSVITSVLKVTADVTQTPWTDESGSCDGDTFIGRDAGHEPYALGRLGTISGTVLGLDNYPFFYLNDNYKWSALDFSFDFVDLDVDEICELSLEVDKDPQGSGDVESITILQGGHIPGVPWSGTANWHFEGDIQTTVFTFQIALDSASANFVGGSYTITVDATALPTPDPSFTIGANGYIEISPHT